MKAKLCASFALFFIGQIFLYALSASTVLVDVDHRQNLSLNGDWHFIVDPYFDGLYNVDQKLRPDGFFLNDQALPAISSSSTISASRPRSRFPAIGTRRAMRSITTRA